MFKVGDRVRIISKGITELYGKSATILDIYDDITKTFYWVIKLDERNRFGHDCEERVEYGYGRLVNNSEIELVESNTTTYESTSTIKKLMNKILTLTEQLELAKKELKERL